MGISNLSRGTSYSMHAHHEPSFLHTMFPNAIQKPIKYALNWVFGSDMLITHDGWWHGTVGDFFNLMYDNVRTISLFREIGLISVKYVSIQIVVSSEWFRVTVSECRENSADHNGGQPGSNFERLLIV